MYKASDLFFQKQGTFSNQCGKCALNNLLGSKQIDCQLLNQICEKFKKEVDQNYRHSFGGDYDINVLMQALRLYDKQCIWLSGSKLQICKSGEEQNPKRLGYLINRRQKESKLKDFVGLSNRHWVAVRQFNNQFYLLDSKAQSNVPEHIMYIAKFLQSQVQKESHIIEVIDRVK